VAHFKSDQDIFNRDFKVVGKGSSLRKFLVNFKVMAKRKRSEQTGPMKQIQQDGVGRKAKVQRVVSSKEKASDKIASLKQKSSSLSENSKPNALRIVIGSYEKVLCGIDARFTSSNAGNVSQTSVSF